MTEPTSAPEFSPATPCDLSRWWLRLTVLAIVAILVATFAYRFRGDLSFASLAQREAEFRHFYQRHPIETLAIAFLVYVVVTGLSLPGAAAMSVLYGWL